MSNSKSAAKTRNALVHGIYSDELVLPWEKEEDFTELFESLRADLNPEGALEEEMVFDIARLHWLKRRAIRAVHIEFHTDPAADKLIELATKGGVQEIDRYVRDKAGEPVFL